MSVSALKKILIDKLIGIEGGYVNNPNDSGGVTKYGITRIFADEYGYKGEIREITRTQAFDMYDILIWQKLKLDDVAKISRPLAEEMLDTATNQSRTQAVAYLQDCLNVFNFRQRYYKDIPVDGIMGQKTIDALKDYMNHRGSQGGEAVLVNTMNCLQGAFYVALCKRREKDEEFAYGWQKNRVNIIA